MNAASNGNPAPYGRSCEECSRSKCKCVLRPEGGRCARCHRLDRQCRSLQGKRRRMGGRSTTRIDRIEQKLDQLLNVSPVIAHVDERSSASSGTLAEPSALTEDQRVHIEGQSPKYSAQDLRSAAKIDISCARDYFNTFKTQYIKWLPFIQFPPGLTEQQLYTEKPILWLSVMVTCVRSPEQGRRLDHLFRQKVADAMVVNSEKSIDLLLGLLVFIGWYHIHSHMPNGNIRLSLSLLMQMAISLVFDLKKPTINQPQQMLAASLHICYPPNIPPVAGHTMEEKRAFLACFLVTSLISHSLQRMDPLRWSSQLNDYLRETAESAEWPGDEILVELVRMQILLEKALLQHWHDSALEPAESSHYPPSFYVSTLRDQLQRVKAAWRPDLQENDLLCLHFYSTDLAITELGLTPRATSNATTSNLQQQKLRFATLHSAKSWFNISFSIPPSSHISQSFSLASQSFRSLAIILYLSTLDEPGWSKEDLRAEIDVMQVMDTWIARVQEAITENVLEEDDVLSKHFQAYQSIRPYWAALLEGSGQSETMQTNSVSQAPVFGAEEAMMGELFDLNFFDTEWLSGWPQINGV